LLAAGRLVGTLTYVLPGPHRLTREERVAIDTVAHVLGAGLASARAHSQMAQAVDARRLAEEALQASEARYRTMVEAAQEGIWTVDATERTTFVNGALATMLGYSVEELEGRSLYSIVDEEDHPALRGRLVARREGRAETGELRLRRKDGSIVWAIVAGTPLFDRAGVYRGALGIVTDITARRVMEQALRRSEERLALAQHVAHIGSWDWDLRTDTQHWSDEVYRIVGLEPGAIAPTWDRYLARVHPDDRAPVLEAAHRALAGGPRYSLDHRVVLPDGTERIMHEDADVLFDAEGRAVRMVGTLQDVTERRQAEDAMARLAAIVESSSDAIVGKAPDGTILTWNGGAERLYGYRAEEVIGRSERLLVPADRAGEELALRARVLRGESVRDYETVRVDRNGRRVEVSLTMSPIRDAQGQIIGVSASGRDISERLQARRERERLLEALQDERGWLRAVIERSPIGILLIESADGQHFVVNQRFEEIMGTRVRPGAPEQGPYAATVSSAAGRILTPEQYPSARALRGEVITSERLVLQRPDGRTLPLQVHAGPIRDENGRILGAVVIVEDDSRARELERLREEWIAVIAHDLRQPVTAIMGNAGVLARHLPTRDVRLHSRAEHILASARQLNRMIADLLDSSRLESQRLELQRHPTDVPALVRATLERMASETREHPVRVRVHGTLPPVLLDPQRFEQVLVNLVSNAVKYGERSTGIDLELSRVGEELHLSVCNYGPGIAADEIPYVFDRYHRTGSARGSGIAGLGLGLYITQGLVAAHGGRIWVQSTPGKTTTFHVMLPIGRACSAS
jgi:PAS domain S-box-containing protein